MSRDAGMVTAGRLAHSGLTGVLNGNSTLLHVALGGTPALASADMPVAWLQSSHISRTAPRCQAVADVVVGA